MRYGPLNTILLLQKLIHIEMVIGKLEPVEVRRMIIDAEDCLLAMQKSAVTRSGEIDSRIQRTVTAVSSAR